MIENIIYIAAAIIAVLVLWGTAVNLWKAHTRVVTIWDYQAGLHFKHGRFVKNLEAGKHRFWGSGHEVLVFDGRINEMVVQGQEVITSD